MVSATPSSRCWQAMTSLACVPPTRPPPANSPNVISRSPPTSRPSWPTRPARITAGASTRYDRAIALQNWFRGFTYDLSFRAGHSQTAMQEFLARRRGYCEQFAGTYAAFARVVGLPSRVAVGFTQGEQRDDGRYYVQGKHAHAWPEIYFDGVGWVPFEPTPGRTNPAAVQYTV